MRQAIYLAGNIDIDIAVERGLIFAGCRIYHANGVEETLTLLEHQANDRNAVRVQDATVVLIAEIDAGAMALLDALKQRGIKPPPTLLIDRKGSDINLPRRAIQLGVKDYLLPEDNESKREWRSRKLVEDNVRQPAPKQQVAQTVQRQSFARRVPSLTATLDLRWDRDSHTIFLGERDRVQLSPAEARTFDLLYAKRGNAVTIDELIEVTLAPDRLRDPHKEIQLLRTHLARLRRRLAANPNFGYRIENLRGSGYMML
jgi:DNA-binding response OmpR family regulator